MRPNLMPGCLGVILGLSRCGPFAGVGKPEPLKHSLSGCWSRRIDETNRLVYTVIDDALCILSCRYHD